MENNGWYIKQIEVGLMQNFSYIVGCLSSKECAVVDPAFEVDRIVETAAKDGMSITSILLTHTHYDHMDGVGELMSRTGLKKIYVHAKEADALQNFKDVVIEIKNENIISLGKVSLIAMHTPGHLPGCVCYRGDNFIITGDTLFNNAIGRCDFPESNGEDMYKSIQRLKALPDQTIVYPGHDYGSSSTSTIGQEKMNNPYLMVSSKDSFLKL